MRVSYDPEIFYMQRRGGISTYFYRLRQQFLARPELSIEPDSMPRFVRTELAVEEGSARGLPLGRAARPLIFNMVNSGSRTDWTAIDVRHFTFYGRRHLPRIPGVAKAITIHDMTPELYPHLFGRRNPHANKATHVQEADLIFCVSETTKTDLLSFYPGVEDRVVVTPHGTGSPFTATTSAVEESSLVARRSVGFPYVMFVGSRDRYKAFDLIPPAIREVRRRAVDIGLVVVGGGGFSSEETRLMEDAGIPASRVHFVSPTDVELASYYRGAVALLYPSDYEGFGLPVLDAMASGCPVIVSDAPALLEVAGAAARVHRRRDAPDLAERIVETLAAPEVDAKALRLAGIRRAKKYTWEASAESVAGAYLAF